MRDLLKNPIWKNVELGYSIPDSDHAVSVALPTWNDVINYEKKNPECIKSLRSIYPRFGLNPLVKRLCEKVKKESQYNNHSIWPYPNETIALKAKKYCDRNTSQEYSFIEIKYNFAFLITKKTASIYAKSFWQHTGLGISSRAAAIELGLEDSLPKSLVNEKHQIIKNRISKSTKTDSNNIHLTSSGMSALHTSLEILYKLFPEKPTLQIGFPYVDVLKLPMHIFHGAKLITEENCSDIELEIKRINPAALIIELPSNPMLKCVNIKKISKIANKLNIPVIVDDTIGSNLNINSLEHADIVFTSLTKIFSGSGDILAGSLILNPKSKWIDQFRNALSEINLPMLSDGDIVSLEKVSRDVNQRVFEQNQTCLELKKRLETNKEIKNIFHPENCPNFNSILTSNGGYGCLLSFELKGGINKAKKFYDSLHISKGPSLGTKFTLVCPYVLLAHYDELDWAESFGIPSHLIRVSVGLEEKDHLLRIFSEALNNF